MYALRLNFLSQQQHTNTSPCWSFAQCYFGQTHQGPSWTGAEPTQRRAAPEHFPAVTTVLRQRELQGWLLGCQRNMRVVSVFTLGTSSYERSTADPAREREIDLLGVDGSL